MPIHMVNVICAEVQKVPGKKGNWFQLTDQSIFRESCYTEQELDALESKRRLVKDAKILNVTHANDVGVVRERDGSYNMFLSHKQAELTLSRRCDPTSNFRVA